MINTYIYQNYPNKTVSKFELVHNIALRIQQTRTLTPTKLRGKIHYYIKYILFYLLVPQGKHKPKYLWAEISIRAVCQAVFLLP